MLDLAMIIFSLASRLNLPPSENRDLLALEVALPFESNCLHIRYAQDD